MAITPPDRASSPSRLEKPCGSCCAKSRMGPLPKSGSRKIRLAANGSRQPAREETLKREAHERLRIGTTKDAVSRFFAENGIPVTFNRDEASGTIYKTGCAPHRAVDQTPRS